MSTGVASRELHDQPSRGLQPARTLAQAEACGSEPRGSESGGRGKLLRRFLQAYWLRPENAFWMTLRSEVLRPYQLEGPSADLSCGDGVFSFIHAGGVLDPAFDVFAAVGNLDGTVSRQLSMGSRQPSVGGKHADMFDYVSDDYQPAIRSPVDERIDVGTDVKRTQLAKAKRLNLYHRLIRHDNNASLPFDNHTFQTIYCNAAYWVENIDGFLTELGRIIRPGGRVILQVKLDSLRRYTLNAHRNVLGDRFLDIIGRGRIESWPSLASRSVWESRFKAAGLAIENATPFGTRIHAHIWDIGLRPVAPLLVKMAGALTPQTRAAIKDEWVDLFCELLEPICNPKLDLLPGGDEPAEIQYILTAGKPG